MRRMQAFYADHFVLPLPPGHTLPDEQVRAAARRASRPSCPASALAEALPASDGELALAHTPGYVDGGGARAR